MPSLKHTEKVLSSNNVDYYTVNIWDDFTADCSCVGFYHRHYCRHVQQVVLALIKRINERNKLDGYVPNEWEPTLPDPYGG